MVVAIALGLFTAVKAGKFADRFLTILALVGISMPVFWVGALMNYYLGFKWGIFPNGGYVPFTEDPWQWFYHLIMPWTALSILFIGVYSRVLRSNILDTINEDYVRTARAKGLSERRVLIKHVLRNSLIPIVTLWGLDFGAVLGGGTILTETVFDLQGVGQYAAESIGQLDVPPVLAITLFGVVLHRPAQHGRGHPLRGPRPAHPADLMAEPLLERPRPRGLVLHRRGRRPGRGRRVVRPRGGRGARRGGRVRLRQVGHGDDADGTHALARTPASAARAHYKGDELIGAERRAARRPSAAPRSR